MSQILQTSFYARLQCCRRTVLAPISPQSQASARYASVASDSPPPLLSKIREDLKIAMRAKDKARLNVLRAIIGEAASAAKSDSPLRTDVQVLSLLKKRIASSQAASAEFAQAARPDLQLKQDEEIGVMSEYADQVQTLPEEEIVAAIHEARRKHQSTAKVSVGTMLKELLGPQGILEGKPVDRAEVSKLVNKSLKETA